MRLNLIIPTLLSCVLLWQCSTEQNNQDTEFSLLQIENEKLRAEKDASDAAYAEIAATMELVDSNLNTIRNKKKALTLSLQNEMPEEVNAEEAITEEINAIKKLMQQNEARVRSLQASLKEKEGTIKGLNEITASLENTISLQQAEIALLQQDLAELNLEYKEVFDELLASEVKNLTLGNELATTWYAYGTKKELVDMGVYSESGLFKRKSLNQDFNKDYFTKLDSRKTTRLDLKTKKAKMVTTHPSSSYEFEMSGKRFDALIIKDPQEFWSVSKYLLIEVEL